MGASSSIKRKSYSDNCIDKQLTSIGKIMTSTQFMMIVLIMNDHDDWNDDKHDYDELMLKIVTSLRCYYYKDNMILTYDTSYCCITSTINIIICINLRIN